MEIVGRPKGESGQVLAQIDETVWNVNLKYDLYVWKYIYMYMYVNIFIHVYKYICI